jgi:acyl-CoA thioester hydrolase
MNSSTIQIRIYYEDTDVGGVVYYANYLRYLERGRTEFLRERGVSLSEYHQKGYLFVVTEVNARYRASARYDDLLSVQTQLTELSSLSMLFQTNIVNQHGVLLNTSTTKLVCIGPSGKAARVPAELAEALQGGVVV